jgi:hypothetical protein
MRWVLVSSCARITMAARVLVSGRSTQPCCSSRCRPPGLPSTPSVCSDPIFAPFNSGPFAAGTFEHDKTLLSAREAGFACPRLYAKQNRLIFAIPNPNSVLNDCPLWFTHF